MRRSIAGDRRGLPRITTCVSAAFEVREYRGRTSRAQCYTSSMPTTKPRYTVTDTGELSDQLDQAQRRWPQVRDRKELLLKLAAAGHDAIEQKVTDRASAVEEIGR